MLKPTQNHIANKKTAKNLKCTRFRTACTPSPQSLPRSAAPQTSFPPSHTPSKTPSLFHSFSHPPADPPPFFSLLSPPLPNFREKTDRMSISILISQYAPFSQNFYDFLRYRNPIFRKLPHNCDFEQKAQPLLPQWIPRIFLEFIA